MTAVVRRKRTVIEATTPVAAYRRASILVLWYYYVPVRYRNVDVTACDVLVWTYNVVVESCNFLVRAHEIYVLGDCSGSGERPGLAA